MASHNYPNPCLDEILKHEGGYSNHPRDPGGVTLEGVIQRNYDAFRRKAGLALKPLTKAMRYTAEWIKERNTIYKTGFWDTVNGDTLGSGVDLAVFDFAVNSGPARARKYLAASVGGSDVKTIKTLCAKRMSFLRGLGTFSTFGTGWTRRVTNVEAKSVSMSLKDAGKSPDAIKTRLDKEAGSASQQSTKEATKAGGTVAAPGAGAGATQAPDTPIPVDVNTLDLSTKFGIACAVVAVLVIAGVFVWRWYVHRERAKAYAEAAKDVS